MSISSLRRLITTVYRRSFSDFPKGCGWERVVENAKCKREAERLDTAEECGVCSPQPEKHIQSTDDITNLTPINGAPSDAYTRNTAIIQKRAKSSMQSGTANTHVYLMTFMTDQTWENPLMGWSSGSNSLKDVEIPFPSLECAKYYTERNGWDCYVPKERPKKKKFMKKDYAANYSWNKRTRNSTK